MRAFSRAGLAVSCVALALSACGGSSHDAATSTHGQPQRPATPSLPAGVVARVGANLISGAQLTRWARVEAALQGAPTTTPTKGLLLQTLEIAILNYWVQEEARKAGVSLSAHELQQAARRRFPPGSASAGLSESDEEFIIEESMLVEKWRRAVLPIYARLRHLKSTETETMVGEVHSEIGKLNARMTSTWTPRTQCGAGYVIELCANHRQ